MKTIITTVAAASFLALSASVLAEQTLSSAEMDGVSAGGFAGPLTFGAVATASGPSSAFAATYLDAAVETTNVIVPQFGTVGLMTSTVGAGSEANAVGAGVSAAIATAGGQTVGDWLSDTGSDSFAGADMSAALPTAYGSSMNVSQAVSYFGAASAVSQSGASAAITN
ncbi:hypothetical protein [Allochromatium vinosum]|uniref:hypothetical protein n=1 Tax=Allochromatium vinosum TaxID=1049 RepID=UPI0019054F6D|nr:hypothetical protein [Allochromatium vinosum]MBK1656162.1 hypothetical protein [Allochromatium vinosum]